ncbi:MAG: deoxyhypusine synthase [Nitrososphaerota archaeon]|nr:deoxyhypusine synthase [Nitrososphaerota archaeon]
MSAVRDLRLNGSSTVLEVVRGMSEMGGFMGPNLARALEVLAEMVRAQGCLRVLTFTGNLIATGLRGIVADALRRRLFDLVVTTCGALDHDVARTRSEYLHGTFDADDLRLREEGFHRLGNVFIPVRSYGEVIEREVAELLRGLDGSRSISTHELCWALGERLGSESSFLYWAWRNRIPVVVPGIYDGAVGYNLWLRGKAKRLTVDVAGDQDLLNDLMWSNRLKGALIIGGGISKHHALWWAQFGGEGFDYAVYVTSSDEYDGSLSGARPKEAVTWGKVGPKSKSAFVKADATLVLPFLYVGLLSLLGGTA